MSTTIRVSESTHQRVARIAAETERPMTLVLDDALDALERRDFFASFNQAWERIRGDEAGAAEVDAERVEWDGTLRDGDR
ncbi:hypothetical protein BH24ACT4_BH24ACT4_04810 [soil metagenome]